MASKAAELLILIKAKDEASAAIGGVQSKLGGFGKVAAGVGIAGAAALVGVGAAAVKMGAEFEGAMREVNTMMGLSEDQFANLNSQVLELSKEVGKSGTELAGALYQAISAGIPASDAIDMLRISAQAAVGGVTDVETAVDGLTTVMNAFKIPATDAEKVADIMFTTVKGGKTTFEELSASMFNVAPLASSLGVGFDEVSAAIATVTKQGVPTTVATTQLRAAIQAMMKPTEEMKAAMDALGVSSGQELIAAKGLQGALDLLTGAAEGNQEQLGKMFGSVEGLNAVLSLTGENAATFAADLSSMADSAGASMAAYDEINKGAGHQFEVLVNKIQALITQLGMKLLPLLTPLIDEVMKLADALPIDEVSEMIGNLLPPLIKLVVDLIKAVPVDSMIKFITSVLEPVSILLGAIMSTITPIITALGPLFDILTVIMNLISPIIEGIAWILSKAGEGLGWLLGGFSEGVSGALSTLPSFQTTPGAFKTVPGAAGEPMAAVVHGGEVIYNPARAGGAMAAPTIVNYYVTVPVYGNAIYERDLAEVIRERLYDVKGSNATLGLE